MYAIEKGMKKVNGREVMTFARLIAEPQTEVAVEAGTTGYTGVESRGGGGRTYLRVLCAQGDICMEPITNAHGDMTGFVLAASGDAGMDAISKMLRFAGKAIDDKRCGFDG